MNLNVLLCSETVEVGKSDRKASVRFSSEAVLFAVEFTPASEFTAPPVQRTAGSWPAVRWPVLEGDRQVRNAEKLSCWTQTDHSETTLLTDDRAVRSIRHEPSGLTLGRCTVWP